MLINNEGRGMGGVERGGEGRGGSWDVKREGEMGGVVLLNRNI